jgi:hypothetical protein
MAVLEQHMTLLFEYGVCTGPEVVDGQRIGGRVSTGEINGCVRFHIYLATKKQRNYDQ